MGHGKPVREAKRKQGTSFAGPFECRQAGLDPQELCAQPDLPWNHGRFGPYNVAMVAQLQCKCTKVVRLQCKLCLASGKMLDFMG
jgi:hypothetical protein